MNAIIGFAYLAVGLFFDSKFETQSMTQSITQSFLGSALLVLGRGILMGEGITLLVFVYGFWSGRGWFGFGLKFNSPPNSRSLTFLLSPTHTSETETDTHTETERAHYIKTLQTNKKRSLNRWSMRFDLLNNIN
jgi:hypothetical protein